MTTLLNILTRCARRCHVWVSRTGSGGEEFSSTEHVVCAVATLTEIITPNSELWVGSLVARTTHSSYTDRQPLRTSVWRPVRTDDFHTFLQSIHANTSTLPYKGLRPLPCDIHCAGSISTCSRKVSDQHSNELVSGYCNWPFRDFTQSIQVKVIT